MRNYLNQSKTGAAAFYVVIFTTLLLSVITMSFIRIMISEATKSTNDDLSKSAYDSALAGVEDAKIALVKYHQCLDKGEVARKDGTACQHIIWAMQNGGCDTVSLALRRNNGQGGEVAVKEGAISDKSESDEMEQAYTCVKLSEDLEDYRAQVSDSNRIRVVPIRSGNLDSNSTQASNLNNIKGIRFSWASTGDSRTENGNLKQRFNEGSTNERFVSSSDIMKYISPIALDFYQTDTDWFTLGELSVNSDATHTDHFSLLFQPNSATDAKSTGSSYLRKDEVVAHSDKYDNEPVKVKCNGGTDFQCNIDIELPSPFRGDVRNLATTLLRVELPYGIPATDFAIKLCTGSGQSMCDQTVNFVGVQARIDSTGRANDLFRRVDARVELIDTNFPYPEFAVQLTGNSGATTEKNFWVTRNCWRSDAVSSDDDDDSAVRSCRDTGRA